MMDRAGSLKLTDPRIFIGLPINAHKKPVQIILIKTFKNVKRI